MVTLTAKDFLEVLMNDKSIDTQKLAYVKSKASMGKQAGTWMHP